MPDLRASGFGRFLGPPPRTKVPFPSPGLGPIFSPQGTGGGAVSRLGPPPSRQTKPSTGPPPVPRPTAGGAGVSPELVNALQRVILARLTPTASPFAGGDLLTALISRLGG